MANSIYLKKRAICTFAVIISVIVTIALFSAYEKNETKNKGAIFDSAFSAEITVTENDFCFEGILKVDKVRSDGIARNAVFVFTAPDSLSGMTATRTDGRVTLSLNDINAPDGGEAYSDVLSFLSLFEPSAKRTISFNGSTPVEVKENADDGVVCKIKSFSAGNQ